MATRRSSGGLGFCLPGRGLACVAAVAIVVGCSPGTPGTVEPSAPGPSPVAGRAATLSPAITPVTAPTATPRAPDAATEPEQTAVPAPPPLPDPTREPTPESTPQPASILTYGSGPLRVDGFAEVLVPDLVLRSLPSDGPESQALPVRIWKGDRLLVLAGPADAVGGEWYSVAASGSPAIGWVEATDVNGRALLAGRAPRCPHLPVAIDTLGSMTPFERLVCFGRRPVTFEAEIGCGSQDGPVSPWGSPWWLAGYLASRSFFGDAHVGIGDLAVAPSARLSWSCAEPSHLVTGHFDDPASSTCRSGLVGPPDVTSDQQADVVTQDPVDVSILACRTRFVITEALARHRVQPGETLRRIARDHSVSLRDLLSVNPWVVDPDLIHVGDLVTIPARPAG